MKISQIVMSGGFNNISCFNKDFSEYADFAGCGVPGGSVTRLAKL